MNRYYVGHCEDISIRLATHNNKGVPSRALASAREKEIKNKKSRKYIEYLINQDRK